MKEKIAKLTPKQIDAIYKAIEDTLNNYHFDNVDDYLIDFALDYEGKVYAEHISFINIEGVTDRVTEKVIEFFDKAAEDIEDV